MKNQKTNLDSRMGEIMATDSSMKAKNLKRSKWDGNVARESANLEACASKGRRSAKIAMRHKAYCGTIHKWKVVK